jgi:hypothetical protein
MGSKDAESAKSDWVADFPSEPPESVELARILEEAPVGDRDFELFDYQRSIDPSFQTVENQRRRFRGQFLRRLKRLSTKSRYSSAG